MSEQRKPAGVKKPAPSNSSRSLAIGAVGLLIVVAIAGIVLAGRNPASPAGAAPAVAGSSAPAASAASTAVNPNEVIFAAGSSKLPVTAADSISRFVESARANGGSVHISARFLTGANKARDHDLAAARTSAIRESLQADGISAGKMQVELIEMPAGTLAEADSDRVDLTLH